jgi:hypothetical protein
MNQQAGTGIWHLDVMKKAQKKQNKKGAQKHIINWQGSRLNEVEAVNQAFGVNESDFSGRLIPS